MSATYLMPTYNRQPISFTRGAGSWLYTKDDTPYLDALTGIAVCGLGHCHPQVTDAIQQQAATLENDCLSPAPLIIVRHARQCC